jgi:hypothetical protein
MTKASTALGGMEAVGPADDQADVILRRQPWAGSRDW